MEITTSELEMEDVEGKVRPFLKNIASMREKGAVQPEIEAFEEMEMQNSVM